MENKKFFIFETPWDGRGFSEIVVVASGLEEARKKVLEKLNDEKSELYDYKGYLLEFFEDNKFPKCRIVEDWENFVYFNQGSE